MRGASEPEEEEAAASMSLNVRLMVAVGLLGPGGGSPGWTRPVHGLYCALIMAVSASQVACSVGGMAREWGHLDGVLTGASEALAVGFTLARHGFLLSRRRAVRRLLAALRRLEERCQGHPIVMRAAGQVRATTLAFNALALLLFGAWTSSPLVRARWLPQGAHAHIFRAACLGDDRYGASLALQALSFAYCFVAVNFDAGAAALMRLAAAQFRVLLASLASLKHLAAGDARVFRQLVACVDHHTAIVEFVRQLDSVYNSILLVQLLYSVLQIAIAGFQFTQISVDFGNSSKFMVAVAFLAVELYLFCSCGEDLMQLSREVAAAAYDLDWPAAGPELRGAVRMAVRAGQNPASLSALRFKKFSMETFLAVLNASYTYFALLRELKKTE